MHICVRRVFIVTSLRTRTVGRISNFFVITIFVDIVGLVRTYHMFCAGVIVAGTVGCHVIVGLVCTYHMFCVFIAEIVGCHVNHDSDILHDWIRD